MSVILKHLTAAGKVELDITELLACSAKQNVYDLHLSMALPPMIRVDGDIRRLNVPVTVNSVVWNMAPINSRSVDTAKNSLTTSAGDRRQIAGQTV